MDHSATIALSGALETEMADLQRQLESLSQENDPVHFEERTNALIDHLPVLLSGFIGGTLARSVLEAVLATNYLEGVQTVLGVHKATDKLLRANQAYDALRDSNALRNSVNPLPQTERAFEVRAAVVAKVLKGQLVQDLRRQLKKTDGMNLEQAQAVMAEQAKKLEDLSTNLHLQNHVGAQEQLAKGYGLFTASQLQLKESPFQEFYRAEHRTEWRDWPNRWRSQGGAFYKGASDYPEGRMIAEVNSRIWENLSDPDQYVDGTGSPYPPFAYNSGMSVKPVSMVEAKKLGLLGAHNKPQKPRKLDFNAGISFSIDFDDDIKSVLLDSMKDWAEKKGEVVYQ